MTLLRKTASKMERGIVMNIKNFEGTNKNIIEIVSTKSALQLLKKSGNENIKISLPLSLSVGKLSSTYPFARNVDGISYDLNDDFEKLKKISNECQKIRVWSSHLNCDDYCLLLLICYLYSDKEISVIFGEELNWHITTIDAITEKEILKLEKREHVLSKSQKEEYCNEWIEIVNDNEELRYMINGKVVSCNYDYFSNKIIEILESTGKISLNKFVTDLMIKPIIPNVVYSDWVYIFLIERLEKRGKIKIEIINNEKYIELK